MEICPREGFYFPIHFGAISRKSAALEEPPHDRLSRLSLFRLGILFYLAFFFVVLLLLSQPLVYFSCFIVGNSSASFIATPACNVVAFREPLSAFAANGPIERISRLIWRP